jgi:microcystin-dependent protein
MSLLLKIIGGDLPQGYDPATWQELSNRICLLARAEWPDGKAVVNYGPSAPAPADRIYPWIRTNPGTGAIDRVYNYMSGNWISPHPTPPVSDEIRIWKGSLSNLVNYDGGAAGTVTDATGPMWEECTELRAKFPLGAGTLPSTTIVAQGDSGGEEKHISTLAEMPIHNHPLNPDNRQDDQHNLASGDSVGDYGGSGVYIKQYNVTGDAGGDPTTSATLGHNTMPPYYAIYFIKRTARVYYTA